MKLDMKMAYKLYEAIADIVKSENGESEGSSTLEKMQNKEL